MPGQMLANGAETVFAERVLRSVLITTALFMLLMPPVTAFLLPLLGLVAQHLTIGALLILWDVL